MCGPCVVSCTVFIHQSHNIAHCHLLHSTWPTVLTDIFPVREISIMATPLDFIRLQDSGDFVKLHQVVESTGFKIIDSASATAADRICNPGHQNCGFIALSLGYTAGRSFQRRYAKPGRDGRIVLPGPETLPGTVSLRNKAIAKQKLLFRIPMSSTTDQPTEGPSATVAERAYEVDNAHVAPPSTPASTNAPTPLLPIDDPDVDINSLTPDLKMMHQYGKTIGKIPPEHTLREVFNAWEARTHAGGMHLLSR